MKRRHHHRRTLRPPHELLQEHLNAALGELKRLKRQGKRAAVPTERPETTAQAPPGLGLLKPAQLELIRMVVARTNDKLENLAIELDIHKRTLANRLHRIYQLMGVEGRAGLAREAVRWGLV